MKDNGQTNMERRVVRMWQSSLHKGVADDGYRGQDNKRLMKTRVERKVAETERNKVLNNFSPGRVDQDWGGRRPLTQSGQLSGESEITQLTGGSTGDRTGPRRLPPVPDWSGGHGEPAYIARPADCLTGGGGGALHATTQGTAQGDTSVYMYSVDGLKHAARHITS